MKATPRYSFAVAALTIALGAQVHAQVSPQTLNTLSTPNRVETRIGPKFLGVHAVADDL